MTQYNTFTVKIFNSLFNELKLGIKNETEVTLKLPSNFVDDSNETANFPNKLLLANTKIRKAFGIA